MYSERLDRGSVRCWRLGLIFIFYALVTVTSCALCTVTSFAGQSSPKDKASNQFSHLTLKALLTDKENPIDMGLVWRVLRENPHRLSSAETLQLVAISSSGVAEFVLEPGSYLVHVSYGLAGATARFDLEAGTRTETMRVNAGGLKLMSMLSGDKKIPWDLVHFDILSLSPDERNGEGTVIQNLKPGKIIRLNADTYRVVARYGDINAVSRAKIKVRPGKLTEATIYHKAAQITFKLLSAKSGRALANVSWSVISKRGTEVKSIAGAFPSVVLAEGMYSVVAEYDDKVYKRSFSVESGYDYTVTIKADKTGRS